MAKKCRQGHAIQGTLEPLSAVLNGNRHAGAAISQPLIAGNIAIFRYTVEESPIHLRGDQEWS